MKDYHVKKPGGWLWTPLSKEEVADRISTGAIQPDWRILRNGESDVITVGEFLERTKQSSISAPAASQSIEAVSSSTETNLKGVGGWLILVTIGLVVTPIRILVVLLGTYAPIFSGGAWSLLTTPGTEAYNPLWKPILLFELFGNAIFFLWSITLLFLLFGHKRIFPKLMIAFYLGSLLFVGIDFLLASAIPAVASKEDASSVGELIRAIFVCVIWVPYFLQSKRVKQTFTE
jgi:hypothetical protein